MTSFELTEAQKEYAARVLNEDESAPEKIQLIKKWIEENDNLKAPTDDFQIQRFLRVSKFNVESAKERMLNYYTQRSNLPEWFANRNAELPEIQDLLKLGTFLPLHGVDDEGRIVVILRVCLHNTDKVPIEHVLKTGLMILDLALSDHVSASIYGIVAIFDMTGVTAGHGLQMTPGVVQKLVHAWQGCYPLRIQSLNFINAPSYVNVVLNIFRKFMNKKLKSRTIVHTGSSGEFIKQKVPERMLPQEYGGSAGTTQELIDFWKKKLEENQEWLSWEEQFRMTKQKSKK